MLVKRDGPRVPHLRHRQGPRDLQHEAAVGDDVHRDAGHDDGHATTTDTTTTDTRRQDRLVARRHRQARSVHAERRRDLRRPPQQLIGHQPRRRRPERDPPRAVAGRDARRSPPTRPRYGRPSAELGRAHARSPRGSRPPAPGRKRVAFASDPRRQRLRVGRSGMNVEPIAEMPRAVTAREQHVREPSAAGQRLDPGLLEHVPGRLGQLELDDDAPQRRRPAAGTSSALHGPAAIATAPAGRSSPSTITPSRGRRQHAPSPIADLARRPRARGRRTRARRRRAGPGGRSRAGRRRGPSASVGSASRRAAPSRYVGALGNDGSGSGSVAVTSSSPAGSAGSSKPWPSVR